MVTWESGSSGQVKDEKAHVERGWFDGRRNIMEHLMSQNTGMRYEKRGTCNWIWHWILRGTSHGEEKDRDTRLARLLRFAHSDHAQEQHSLNIGHLGSDTWSCSDSRKRIHMFFP